MATGSKKPDPSKEAGGAVRPSDEQSMLLSKQRAADYLKEKGLGEREQTKISLFLQHTKMANSLILPRVEFQPMDWLPYKFFHQQLFKNMELATLLLRATRWTMDPMVYLQFGQVSSNFWKTVDIIRHVHFNLTMDETMVNLYQFLAFSHGLLSEIRMTPLVMDLPTNRYIELLYELEEENGRQIQLQVRLLKGLLVPLTLEEKEQVIMSERSKIASAFRFFLDFLAEEHQQGD